MSRRLQLRRHLQRRRRVVPKISHFDFDAFDAALAKHVAHPSLGYVPLDRHVAASRAAAASPLAAPSAARTEAMLSFITATGTDGDYIGAHWMSRAQRMPRRAMCVTMRDRHQIARIELSRICSQTCERAFSLVKEYGRTEWMA